MSLAHILSSGFSCEGKPQPQQLTQFLCQLHSDCIIPSLRLLPWGLGSGPKNKSSLSRSHRHSYSAGSHCSLHKRGDRHRIKMGESFTGQRKAPSCPRPSSIQPGEAAPCCAFRDPAGWRLVMVLKKAAGKGSWGRQRNPSSYHSQRNNSKQGESRNRSQKTGASRGALQWFHTERFAGL